MIEDIKKAVHDAAATRQKMAMFHYQILLNAEKLEGVNAADFCREIGVPVTFQREFQKMISLARLIKDLGKRIS